MQLFVVIEMQGGVAMEIAVYKDAEVARRRGLDAARDLDILDRPWDWDAGDGEWQPELGSTRSWRHHWYSDENDVVLAACQVE